MATPDIVTLADAAGPDAWRMVDPGGPAPTVNRRYVGMDGEAFESRRPASIPSSGAAVLRWPVVLGCQGWVFASSGAFVDDCSWYRRPASGAPLPAALPEPSRMEARCVLLASEWAGENFGHCLLDLLPRIDLLQRSGLLAGDETWLVPRLSIGEASALLSRTGIDPERIAWLDPGSIITAPEVVVATFPGVRYAHPEWVVRYLREHFADAPLPGGVGRRLYLTRAGYRRAPTNDAEVAAMLHTFGFETLDCRVNPGNARFGQASIVLGANAAAMANAVFCRPGSLLIELVPSDHVFPHFLDVACAAGLNYVGVGCRSLGARRPGEPGPSVYDFDVDVDALRTVVAEVTGEQSLL